MTNQAKWYFNGPWPIQTGIKFQLEPEPKTMQELINLGLVVKKQNILTGKVQYHLTEKGKKKKECQSK